MTLCTFSRTWLCTLTCTPTPGREPDDIDTDQLHQLVIANELKANAAAHSQLAPTLKMVRLPTAR
jgi:hypothetical protein